MNQEDRGRIEPAAPRVRVARARVAGVAVVLVGIAAWFVLAGRGGPVPRARPSAGRAPTAAVTPTNPEAPVPAAGPTGESAPETSAPRVFGRVVHLDRKPAAGATLSLFVEKGRVPSYPAPAAGQSVDPALLRDLFRLDEPESVAAAPAALLPPPEEAAPESPAVGTAKSAEDGAFEIPVDGEGPFLLEASLEGAGSVAIGGLKARGRPLTVVLGTPAALQGIVLEGSARTPIAGASVLATRGKVVRRATSGADGTFEITGLIPGPCGLLVGAPGFPPVRLQGVDVPTERGPVEVVFQPTRTLLVRVMRRDALPLGRKAERDREAESEQRPRRSPPTPVEGATVVAWQGESGTYATAVTGVDGRVRLENLSAGSWSIAARAEGLLSGSAASYRPGFEGPAEEEHEIVLEPAVARTVRVVDATGAPVPDARVFWGGAERELDLRLREAAGRTVGDGTVPVVFDEAIPRRSALWVEPPEGAIMRVEPSLREESGEVRAVVRPGRIVRGTVRDRAGSPVAGATVTLKVEAESREFGISLRTATDGSGAFVFPRVAFGAVRVGVEGESDYTEARREADVKEDPLVVDLRLSGTPD